eukprot:scaffold996_cov409-Prasinococcus_capsulatus_cf.AAC.18
MVESKSQDTEELQGRVLELNQELARIRDSKDAELKEMLRKVSPQPQLNSAEARHTRDAWRSRERGNRRSRARHRVSQAEVGKPNSLARCRHDSALAIAAAEQELANTRAEIQGLEDDITELRKLIAVREGWVRERDAIIKKKDSSLLEMQQESIEKSKALDWLQQRFAEKVGGHTRLKLCAIYVGDASKTLSRSLTTSNVVVTDA